MDIGEFGLRVGSMPKGTLNSICDVSQVRVGHVTLDEGDTHTGVTVVMPCEDNMFCRKLVGASFVLNGFGKTLGLVQLDELCTLETPIALTNTLNVGLVHDALVSYMLKRCAQDGVRLTSVNPIVCECNDSSLNDISLRAVKAEHVFEAINSASVQFSLGAVGAGRGMTCHGLKGGIGTASRLITLGDKTYTLGALLLTNHGRLPDLTLGSRPIGREIDRFLNDARPDKGSCIAVIATDLPLSSRQLKRVLKRAGVGLCRVGSYLGHFSGDVFVGFSTANRVPDSDQPVLSAAYLNEEYIDLAFRACAEAVEEAVISSLINAEPLTGYRGNSRRALTEFLSNPN